MTLSQGARSRISIARTVGARGVGLHSGESVRIALKPAPAGFGVRFRTRGRDIPATFERVIDTRLGVTLADPDGRASVATVEHLLAALAGREIDDILIEVEGPEIPALDGSAGPYAFLLDTAGRREVGGVKRVVRVKDTVEVREGDRWVRLDPAEGFDLDVSIDYPDAAVGSDRMRFAAGPRRFDAHIARARTFGFAGDIEAMHAAGLARGGGLANAVIVDDGRVANADGLRAADEFVRHKILDCVGDLSLAGAELRAAVTASKPGHSLNVAVLIALFADPAAFEIEDAEPLRAAA